MHGDHVIGEGQEEEHGLNPKRADRQSAGAECEGAQQEHDRLCDKKDRDGEEWKNDVRNAGLGKHRGQIGNGQRLPEQDAAIAALAIKGVEAIEDRDEHSGDHNQSSGKFVRFFEDRLAASQVGRGEGTAHGGDEEADQCDSGDGQGSDIDGPVLPQFAPDRPVQRASRGQSRGHDSLRLGESLRHGVRLRIHRALLTYLLGGLRLGTGHDGDEHVGDAGRAYFAEWGQLVAIGPIEQKDRSTECLTLVHWFHSASGGKLVGIHGHFEVARGELFHGATEHNSASVDEHEIGEDVFDLVDLVRGHNNGAIAVEVVVQQRVVKLLAIKDVESQRGFIEHEQTCVDRHHQREVKLRDHALGEFPHFARVTDGGLRQKAFRLGAIEARVHALDVVKGVRDLEPAREHGDIGDEADVAHQQVALSPGISPQNPEFALIGREAEDGVQGGCLAGAVWADESEDAAVVDTQIHAVECDGGAEAFTQSVSFYARHGFSVPPFLDRWNSMDFLDSKSHSQGKY